MKIYLAASVGRWSHMERYKRIIEQKEELRVVSSWHGAISVQPGREESYMDLRDIVSADVLALFLYDKPDWPTKGGKFFEAGYAVARGKILVTIGTGPCVHFVETFREREFISVPDMVKWLLEKRNVNS